MRLTRQSRIAVAILTACAETGGKPLRTREAAKAAEATKDHAARVVNALVHAGFLNAMRGRQGGIALAAPASEILLGDVLRHTQPDLAHHSGESEGDAPTSADMAFNAVVGAAEAGFLAFMDRFSIADLVGSAADSRIGCLDCALLNPARRKSNGTTPPYQHAQSAPRRQDGPHAGLVIAERVRTERSRHHAHSFLR